MKLGRPYIAIEIPIKSIFTMAETRKINPHCNKRTLNSRICEMIKANGIRRIYAGVYEVIDRDIVDRMSPSRYNQPSTIRIWLRYVRHIKGKIKRLFN